MSGEADSAAASVGRPLSSKRLRDWLVFGVMSSIGDLLEPVLASAGWVEVCQVARFAAAQRIVD